MTCQQTTFPEPPLLADLHQQSGDQSQTGCLIWKHPNHSCPSAYLLVYPLQAVSGPDGSAVLKRKVKDREPFRQIVLQPC